MIDSKILTDENVISIKKDISKEIELNISKAFDEKKIIFENSNVFFKNNKDEVLFINKISDSEFYYDSNKLENLFSSSNEIFNIPFKSVSYTHLTLPTRDLE